LILLLAGCASRSLGDSDGAPPDMTSMPFDIAAPPADLAFRFGVPCGTTICNPNLGESCCEIELICTTTTCKNPGEQIDACDGPEDCQGAGQVCCMFINPFFGTACTTSCDATNPNTRNKICHSKDDCAPNEGCCQLETSGNLFGCVAGVSC
jgi:hypothetical protein